MSLLCGRTYVRAVSLPSGSGSPRTIAAVRPREAVLRLHDRRAAAPPDDAPGLIEHDLQLPRILARPLPRHPQRLGAGDDVGELADAAFRLRHDLLREGEDVAPLELPTAL